MRLPAYRASYLGRYHPYPRTRVPAREVVMVCALLQIYANNRALKPPPPPSVTQSASEGGPSKESRAAENVDTVSDLAAVL